MILENGRKGKKAAQLHLSGISTGFDIEVISRIKGLIQKKAFIDRVFTEREASCCLARSDPARHFSQRFASKEACMKALGTGLTAGIRWRDIEVVTKENGAPSLILRGRARALMRGDGGKRKIFLSISHGAGLAAAFVAIE